MQQLILKNDIEKSKIDALLNFLKSWDIDAEFKSIKSITTKRNNDFTLSVGIWKDYDIDAKKLRKQVWNRNK